MLLTDVYHAEDKIEILCLWMGVSLMTDSPGFTE